MIEKIYFDLDNTLADFTGGVNKLGFVPTDNKVISDNIMFDLIRSCNHFYANLEPYPDSLDMINKVIETYGLNKVEILSGLPKQSRNITTASEDKISWCKKWLPYGININLCLRREKSQFCKGKGYVLIDDNKNNCKEWELVGGTAIRFNKDVDVLKILKEVDV